MDGRECDPGGGGGGRMRRKGGDRGRFVSQLSIAAKGYSLAVCINNNYISILPFIAHYHLLS